MNRETVKAAISEAHDFITKARGLLNEKGFDHPYDGKSYESHPGVKAAGVRRASMELTRALAEMRKPL